MNRANAIEAAYLLCAILFILGLRRLSSPATARSGNQLAAVGMTFAIVATLLDERVLSYEWIALGAVIGGVGGAIGARKVKMTAMPQMVALFTSPWACRATSRPRSSSRSCSRRWSGRSASQAR
jgi:proton-translocating NAD(P)+ transhydrogenase subunit beta